MAFTGTPVVTQVTDRLVRITGLSLAKSVAGTIGLNGDGTAGVQLPAGFQPQLLASTTIGTALTPSDVIRCDVNPAGANADPSTNVHITKAGAAFSTPFQITITNDDATDATPALEIWVSYH